MNCKEFSESSGGWLVEIVGFAQSLQLARFQATVFALPAVIGRGGDAIAHAGHPPPACLARLP